MKIIGFNLFKIFISRKEKLVGILKTSQKIDIQDVKEEKVPISTEEAIKIKFKFTIDYSNEFAKVEFEGFIILLPEKEDFKDFIDSWKEKQIPEKSRIPLFNFIINKCNVKALTLEDDLGLPTHISMPRLDKEQEQK